MKYLLVILVLVAISGVRCFPDGAPAYQCGDAYPRHGHDAQPADKPVPYEITTSKDTYEPGDRIEIKIEGKSVGGTVTKFRGFHIRVGLVGHDQEQAIGYFHDFDIRYTRGQSWYPQPEYPQGIPNCVTHTDSSEKEAVTVTWEASGQDVGDIDVKVTIVQSHDVFWVDQTVRLPGDPVVKTEDPSEISEEFAVPNFDECGETKGCLLFPRDCDGLGCTTAVSWRRDPNNEDGVFFEVMAKTEGYVSVGLSEDTMMGDDSTVTCMEKDGEFGIKFGFNTPDIRQNDGHRITELTDIAMARVGDKLFCRYRQPKSYTFYYEDMETAERTLYSYKFSMDDEKHVLVASGPIYSAGTDTDCIDGKIEFRLVPKTKATGHVRHTASNTKDKCEDRCVALGPTGCYGYDWRNSGKQCWINAKVSNYNNKRTDNSFNMYIRHDTICSKPSMTLDKHDTHPLMSEKATSLLTETDVMSASSMSGRIKAHATLGILAWLTMAALSILLARHYRFVLSCLCLGRGCWFGVHATLNILVTFLTVATVVLQFTMLQDWTEYATGHAVVGLILTVFVIVQTIAGLCRPDPESGARSIFNWVHRISGVVVFVIAAVTILLGVNVSLLDEGFRSRQTVVVAVWLAFIVLWEILLELLSCCAKSSGAITEESEYDQKAPNDDDDGGRRMTSVLFIFALVLFLLVTLGFFIWSLLNLFYFY